MRRRRPSNLLTTSGNIARRARLAFRPHQQLQRLEEITIMITDDIKSAYNRGKWALVIRGLLGIAVGIFIIARPLESVAAFALVIAFWSLADGIVSIVHAIDLRSVIPHWWGLLLGGIVSVIFGIAAFYLYPGLSL